MLPFEDEVSDILEKAAVGRRVGFRRVAEALGVSVDRLRKFFDQPTPGELLIQVAERLHLDGAKLTALASGAVETLEIEVAGLRQVTQEFIGVSYPNATVNSYLIGIPDSGEVIAFDAGCRAEPILAYVEKHNLRIRALFLTHTHRDHVGGYEHLLSAVEDRLSYCPASEPFGDAHRLSDSSSLSIAGLTIKCIATPGHSPGGMSYGIVGLKEPIVVTGDALLAASIGGVSSNLDAALQTIRSQLLSLPSATVICPGHGPLSSIVREKKTNPFF